MLRRKAKRLGKKAFKFRFVTTVLTADLEAGPEWTRTGSLVVQWVRHGRNVATDPAVRLDDYNGRIHAEWHEPLGMVSTLYKDERSATFEDKEYEFRLWETKNDRLAKQLCTATLDYANYASVDTKAVEVTLDLQPLNKRITRGSLHLTIQCEPVASDAGYIVVPAWHRSSASLFDSLSDASGVNLNRDDESALEAGSLASVEPETPRETYQDTIQQLAAAKSSKAKSHTAEWDRFADHALEGKSASDLRKLVAEARKLAERERAELEAIHTALVSDYANVKVRLAQAEYDKDRIRLERIRAAQQVAQLKLKVMEQQQLITKLEARHAGGKRT